MGNQRPTGVTLISVLGALGALFAVFSSHRDLSNFEDAQWVANHPREAQIEQLYYYFDAGLNLLGCYGMMKAHRWGRWLYLGWNALRLASSGLLLLVPQLTEHAAFLRFRPAMIPSVCFFFLALWLLCRADAREYFSNGRRPWWRE